METHHFRTIEIRAKMLKKTIILKGIILAINYEGRIYL